jgi:uncharacterized membrane protein YraQ (UPF0718 family)
VSTSLADQPSRRRRRWRPESLQVLAALLIVVVAAQGPLRALFDSPAMRTWATVFVAIVVQAVPFLVLGVLVSAAIGVFVPAGFFARALPRRAMLAVPVAGLAGVALPGCECGSVPIAGGLLRRGVAPAAAFAFLLSAPAINPIVLVATAVAFPHRPAMVFARFGASVLTSVLLGWLWLAVGKAEWIRIPARPELSGMSRWAAFWVSVRHDFVHAGGFLVVGGMTAAVLNVTVPRSWLNVVAGQPVLSVLTLAVLAVVLSICSEADAFVASALTQFSLTARLAFLVVGPMIDVKLFAMQAGTFGRGFALRFGPATFVVAVAISVAVGAVAW